MVGDWVRGSGEGLYGMFCRFLYIFCIDFCFDKFFVFDFFMVIVVFICLFKYDWVILFVMNFVILGGSSFFCEFFVFC